MAGELIKGVSFADMLGSASGVSEGKEVSIVDIITFAEASWGFRMGDLAAGVPALLPAQRWVMKAFYGLPMDNVNKYIPIHDMFNENLLYMFTEQEFTDYLYNEGRLNTRNFHDHFQILGLVCGRRGTKTSVTSLIAGYEIYKMLSQYHPQAYFGVFPEDTISMTCLSTTEENAKILYDRTVQNMEVSSFFKDFMHKDPNSTVLELKSARDKKEFADNPKKYTIKFIADACSAKGLRGPNNIFVALDEVAHFFKDSPGKASSDKSDKAVDGAVTPSMAMFSLPPKEEGGKRMPAGRKILISSPSDKTGLLWEEFQRSFEPGIEDILMIQMPSWEMNHKIPSDFLRSEYRKSPLLFRVEYGAEFSDQLSGWLDDPSIIKRCISEDLRLTSRSNLRIPYFLGGDIGLQNDATAFAIVHVEEPGEGEGDLPVIVLDWYEEWFANKEKEVSENGAEPYYEIEEVVSKIEDLTKRFNIHKGLFDQYYDKSLMPAFRKTNLTQMECRKFTDTLNSEVYQNLHAKLVSKGIKLPATGETDAKGNAKDIDLISEMTKLQVIKKSKYLIKVFMPEGKNQHDDKSDAFARAVQLATEYIDEGGVASSRSLSPANRSKAAVRAAARLASQINLQRPRGGIIYKSGNRRYR